VRPQPITGPHAPAHLPVVGSDDIDAFLRPEGSAPRHAILFFPGAATQRPETQDVAVILPELLEHFAGRLRGAIIAAEAEEKLKGRFQVVVMPSLVVTRDGEPVGVLPKIQDWSAYVAKISDWLEPDAPTLGAARSDQNRVEFVYTRKG
jgi:hydrogenase-1 operon protein HyaE